MRKLILVISFMALPLAACGQQQDMPPETDPIEQLSDVPVQPSDGDAPAIDDAATDRSAMKPATDEPQPEPAMPMDDKNATE